MSRPVSSLPSAPVSPAPVPSAPPPRSRLLLMGLLGVLVLAYLAVRPMLNRMQAETERMTRQNAANQTEEARLRVLRSAFDQAKQRAVQNPGDPQAQGEMAQRCEEAGNIEEALQYAEAALRLQPKSVETLLVVARLRQRLKHYDGALDAYQQALAAKPDEPRALTGLSYLYVVFGWPLMAERLLTPAVQQQPNNLQLKVALALAYVQHENSAQAERLMLDVKRMAPNDAPLWTPLVDVYMNQKRYADALQTAAEVLRQTPDNKAVQLLQGQAYYYLNDLDKSRQTLQRLLSADPNHAAAYYYLGLCASKTGDVPEAIRQMEAGLRSDPGSLSLQRTLGQLYLRVHRDTEGRKLTAQAAQNDQEAQRKSRLSYQLANHPDSPEAHRQMAQVYEEQKDLPRAIVEWKQVLHYRPDDTQAHAALRTVLQAAGRSQEAAAL